MPYPHLKHWDEVRYRHIAVTEFIAWLEAEYSLSFDFERAKSGTPLEIKRLVDEFFEVDRGQLEAERDALWEQFVG